MPKQTTPLALAIPPRAPGTTATRWLYDALRVGILEGRYGPGHRLPSSRELARHYALSRGTIVAAFERLRSEGYVGAGIGSGTYVASVLPVRAPRSTDPRPAVRRRLSAFARRARPLGYFAEGPVRAFRTNQPALDLVPRTLWAQVAGRRLRSLAADFLLQCGPLGYRPLQEAVADYLTASRGTRCTPDQVVILSGVQEALDLVARLVLDPGDRVAIEEPGYDGASLVFAAAGAGIVGVPVDDEGLRVDPARLNGARLVYVTPAHQFPIGVGMSLARRLALLEWARKAGAMVFEDDYDSEYRYAGRAMPALQGLDRHGVVLFAGTFSKVLFPSLRLGYLVVPADLIDRVAAVRSITQRHAPLLEQAVLADFIVAGHFARHIRRMREIYAERLAALLEAAHQRLAGLLDVSPIEAGLQTVGWLHGPIDEERAARAAARRDVEVTPLGRYWLGHRARQGLQLGFAAVDVPEIRRGVRELAMALESLA